MTNDQLILLVDDDDAVRESLKFALELEGVTVETCASGAELLRHPALDQVRCLIIDYKMPGMDGLEVIARLTKTLHKPQVIMITGYLEQGLRDRALRAGALHLLEKPLSDGALLDRINQVLAAQNRQIGK